MTRNRKTSLTLLYVILALVAMAFLPFEGNAASHDGTKAAGTVPLSCGKWGLVPSPSPDSSAVLSGVAAISARNVWVVGSSINSRKKAQQTLTEQWNGSRWKVVPSPNVGTSNNVLTSIAVVSASNMWAVGNSTNSSGFAQTLTEQWNGSQWKVVPSPNLGSTDNYLLGVAVVSANDIWTVGMYFYGAQQQTLIEHFNGTNWTVVPSPNPGTYDFLYGVTAVSATSVWAVGNHYKSGGNDQTLIVHWNGTSWKVVSSPNPGPNGNDLLGVTAVSASDIWAVGGYANSGRIGETLTMHWNGTSWKVVSSPNPGPNGNDLLGMAVVSASDIWAVGDYMNGSGIGETLTEHWNGTSWKVVNSPNVRNATSNILNNAASIRGSGDVWAVGYYSFGEGSDQTLSAFYC